MCSPWSVHGVRIRMELPSLITLPVRGGNPSKLVWKQRGPSKAPRHQ